MSTTAHLSFVYFMISMAKGIGKFKMSRKLFDKLAEESIKWQSTSFFDDLTEAFEELLKERVTVQDALKSKALKRIVSIIKLHTNISVRINLNDLGIGPAIMPPDVTNSDIFRNIIAKILKYRSGSKSFRALKDKDFYIGTVNLKTSKVGGEFANMVNTVYIPIQIVSAGSLLTARELAAVYIHEVGHAFTHFEYANRLVSTNQVLTLLHKEYSEANTEDERIELITTARKYLKLKKETVDVASLAKATDPNTVSVVILKEIAEDTISELGCNVYDLVSSEQLADEFAVRHGAGLDIVVALDKLHKNMNAKFFSLKHMSYRSNYEYIVVEMIKLLGVLLVPTNPLTQFIKGLIWGLISIDSSNTHLDPHDKPEARYRRVKEQLVNRLKDKRLSDLEVKTIQEGIAKIDKILESVKDKYQIIDLVLIYLIPGNKHRMDFQKLQQELETLANNDLFLKATQLKTT